MGATSQKFEGYSGVIRFLPFLPDCKQVMSGSSDETVRLWDPTTGALLYTLKGPSDNETQGGTGFHSNLIAGGEAGHDWGQ